MKGMDFGDLMKQAQKMTKQMGKIQSSLKERIVEGTSGGGAIKVYINGSQEVVDIKVDPETLDPEEIDMFQDLLIAAINQALKKSKDLAQEEFAKVTGGALPPGLMGM
jgi:hypothetical protein